MAAGWRPQYQRSVIERKPAQHVAQRQLAVAAAACGNMAW